MPVVVQMPAEERTVPLRMAPPSRFADKVFEWLTLGMALVVVVLVFLVGWQLARGSSLAIRKFGFLSRHLDLGSSGRAVRRIAASLFKPGYTLASVIANEFTEATSDVYLQALFEIGLVLFGITILANLIGQGLLRALRNSSATRAA